MAKPRFPKPNTLDDNLTLADLMGFPAGTPDDLVLLAAEAGKGPSKAEAAKNRATLLHRKRILPASGGVGRTKVGVLAQRYGTDEALLAALNGYRKQRSEQRLLDGAKGDLSYGWMTLAAATEDVPVKAIHAAWNRLHPEK